VKTCPQNIGPYNVGIETHWQYLLQDTWLECENLPQNIGPYNVAGTKTHWQ